jgi:MbtH protein
MAAVPGSIKRRMVDANGNDTYLRTQQSAAERSMSWGDEDTNFHVVVNDEEQYSIWPDYKAIPAGWRQAGKSGKREECLAWVDEVWTDMRPLSLRQAMAEDAAKDAAARAASAT